MEQREHSRFKLPKSVSFLPKTKSHLFFNLKKPKFRIFPAESKFIAVKSSSQNLCFCNTVLKVGANINAVKFCSKYVFFVLP